MTEADVNAAKARLRGTLAQQLLAAARLVQSRDRLALATAFPPASRPGQYPRRRSGALLQSSTFEPQTLPEIQRALDTADGVKFFRAAPYDRFLAAKGRLTLKDTIDRLRGQLAAMFGGGVRAG